MTRLRSWIALALAIGAGVAAWMQWRAPSDGTGAAMAQPPALARLTRGVNLSTWLQHGPAQADYMPDSRDWARLAALGLQHVRVPVDPAALVDERGLPRPQALAGLRAAIEGANRAGLLVVLAAQLPPEPKARLVASEPDRVALAGFWRWLAGALRDLPADKLAFEPLNEPETSDAAASRALLQSLAGEIRAVAPKHTLIVSGHRYAGVVELEMLEPLADANVVYSFHFYEPHNFTHQGADWGDPAWKLLRNFPYPSSPEAVAARLASAPAGTHELMKWHGEQRWDKARIGALIESAAQWGRTHRVPVWCSEFGVLKTHALAADRAAWLTDVRSALEQQGIGWTHWDYAGAFGIVQGEPGQREPDGLAIEALGLATQ
ncbi:MAG: glycoside hydrolase family 5 protein [Gammaproteobacteria bacterium]